AAVAAPLVRSSRRIGSTGSLGARVASSQAPAAAVQRARSVAKTATAKRKPRPIQAKATTEMGVAQALGSALARKVVAGRESARAISAVVRIAVQGAGQVGSRTRRAQM